MPTPYRKSAAYSVCVYPYIHIYIYTNIHICIRSRRIYTLDTVDGSDLSGPKIPKSLEQKYRLHQPADSGLGSEVYLDFPKLPKQWTLYCL